MTPIEAIASAKSAEKIFPSTADNINAFLASSLPGWAKESIEELVNKGEWSELNDRFYRYLEFGTGGMRGRTVGVVTAKAETGTLSALGAPEHAAIGSNMLNDLTLIRAVVGLYRYTAGYLAGKLSKEVPSLVIAHDVRHFSRHFCELAASTWSKLGGKAYIFDGPRPTPQLSFSVRWLKANAGIVITASHNPPHDNGFKAYFEDGAQVIAPHDKGIVDQVNAVPLGDLDQFLAIDIKTVTELGKPADDAYLSVASLAAIDTSVFRKTKLKVAFTNIHGTGCVHGLTVLLHAGCEVHEVQEQLAFDPRFPTVKSPNPENAEALAMAVALAERENCDVVLATDPDCDRMGCGVRTKDGKMQLLTGNQIGSLLADYRLARFKEKGWIPQAGSQNVCIIKTVVTTGLQEAIGKGHGVKVIDTLTGFKWIAAKMKGYEEKLVQAKGPGFDYDSTPYPDRARLLQEHSTFYAFGTEESYGYLPNDFVRDKDGNAACLMFAELCAWVKSRGLTVPEYLDEIYLKFGFYLEGVINIYYEGASGNAKIKRIIDSYRSNPPTAFGDVTVSKFQDYGREVVKDADGEVIPTQDLYVVTLSNGYTFAARGSGTEPKMKFYLFASQKVTAAAELEGVKKQVKGELDRLKALIESDAKKRAEG